MHFLLLSKYIESIRVEIKYLKEIMSKAVPTMDVKNDTNIEVNNSESNRELNINTIHTHTNRVLPNTTKRSYSKLKNLISSTNVFTVKQYPSDGVVGVRVKNGIHKAINTNMTSNKYNFRSYIRIFRF